MSATPLLSRLRINPYLLALLGTVAVAALVPASGPTATVADGATDVAIAGLFFLYGARLSSQAVLDGLRHWRLHLTVLLATFVLFPLLGLAAGALVPVVLPPALYAGVLFLTTLPSTVQSSIAFTGTARGNVAAAICSASMSNMLGIVLTPLLVALLMSSNGGGIDGGSIVNLFVQLVLPFIAGHVARRWIGAWMERHSKALGYYDRGSILLVVYVAFSKGVVSGVWGQVTPAQLATLVAVIAVLLSLVLVGLPLAARALGFNRGDESAILFCGSVKSLATGLPMANVLFAGQNIGTIVLPIILYHLLQLMVCATLAEHRGTSDAAIAEPVMTART